MPTLGSQSFTHHIHTLNRLWDWGEDHDIGDLPSFEEWLDTPVEPTLTSWPDSDIMSGVNPLDTQVLLQHGWQTKETAQSSGTSDASSGNPSQLRSSAQKNLPKSKESAFQTLLRDLLNQADQCRELLATLDLVQTRSHQTEQTQAHHLQHTEDLLLNTSLKSLDHFFQALQAYWDQSTTIVNLPPTLVVPDQDTHIWIEAKSYDALFQGFSGLVDAWLDGGDQDPKATPDPSSLSAESPQVPTITLTPQILGKSLIFNWQETTPAKQSMVMDISRLQKDWADLNLPWLIERNTPSPSELSPVPGGTTENEPAQDANDEASSQTAPIQRHVMIQMPLAPAQCKRLVCRVNNDLYGLPIEQIEQLILPKTDQLKMATGGVLMLQWQIDQTDQLLRVYPLSQLIQYSHSAAWVGHRPRQGPGQSKSEQSSNAQSSSPSSAAADSSAVALTSPSPILLLKISQQWVGIMVNEVVAENLLLLRPLGNAIASPPWVQGCSLIHDRQFALSIDLKILLRQAVGFGL